MNHAAAISARNTRRRTAKRCATTRISPMFSGGNPKAMGRSPPRTGIGSHSNSRPFSSRKGATNDLSLRKHFCRAGAPPAEPTCGNRCGCPTIPDAMNFKLKVWRQKDPKTKGKLVEYKATNVSPNTSFLEMLDVVNEELIAKGEEPIAFDSDCREGICGTCALTINGEAHGPDHPGAACEVYMRR